MNKCNYNCFRKEYMPFEPEKWDKLDDLQQSFNTNNSNNIHAQLILYKYFYSRSCQLWVIR